MDIQNAEKTTEPKAEKEWQEWEKEREHEKRQSELRSALSSEDLERVRLALAAGADVNEKDANGATPLTAAISRGDAAMVAALAARGAKLSDAGVSRWELEKIGAVGRTPLMDAAARGSRDELESCLAQEAGSLDARDNLGRTAFMIAAEAGHSHVAGRLMEAGASLATKDIFGRSAKDLALARAF